MVYYWFRLIQTFVTSRFFSKKIQVDSSITRTRRVSFFDCEGLRFMANSRYLFYMDFIRYEVLFRSPLYKNTVKKGMFAVLGSQKIIYRRPLRMWSKFDLSVEIEGADEKWAYHKQVFSQDGNICAIGYTKLAFWKNRESQSMTDILKACGHKEPPRPPKPKVLALFSSDYDLLH